MKRIIPTWLVLCAALFGAWQASAQMPMTGAGLGAPGGGGGSASFTLTDSGETQNCSATVNCTFTVTTGTASADRVVLLAISDFSLNALGPPTAFVVTIDGNAMSCVYPTLADSYSINSLLCYLPYMTGTSSTVVFTATGETNGMGTTVNVVAYRLNGLSSSTPTCSPSCPGVASSAPNYPQSLTITVPSGGFAIMTAGFDRTTTPSWNSPSVVGVTYAGGGGGAGTITTGTCSTGAGCTAGSQTMSFTGSSGFEQAYQAIAFH
jgi:hypothetical protein